MSLGSILIPNVTSYIGVKFRVTHSQGVIIREIGLGGVLGSGNPDLLVQESEIPSGLSPDTIHIEVQNTSNKWYEFELESTDRSQTYGRVVLRPNSSYRTLWLGDQDSIYNDNSRVLGITEVTPTRALTPHIETDYLTLANRLLTAKSTTVGIGYVNLYESSSYSPSALPIYTALVNDLSDISLTLPEVSLIRGSSYLITVHSDSYSESLVSNNVVVYYSNNLITYPVRPNNCGIGKLGNIYNYIIPANTYFAATQLDVDKLVVNDISTNSQASANLYGSCSISSMNFNTNNAATNWGENYASNLRNLNSVDGVITNSGIITFKAGVSIPSTNPSDIAPNVQYPWSGGLASVNFNSFVGSCGSVPRNIKAVSAVNCFINGGWTIPPTGIQSVNVLAEDATLSYVVECGIIYEFRLVSAVVTPVSGSASTVLASNASTLTGVFGQFLLNPNGVLTPTLAVGFLGKVAINYQVFDVSNNVVTGTSTIIYDCGYPKGSFNVDQASMDLTSNASLLVNLSNNDSSPFSTEKYTIIPDPSNNLTITVLNDTTGSLSIVNNLAVNRVERIYYTLSLDNILTPYVLYLDVTISSSAPTETPTALQIVPSSLRYRSVSLSASIPATSSDATVKLYANGVYTGIETQAVGTSIRFDDLDLVNYEGQMLTLRAVVGNRSLSTSSNSVLMPWGNDLIVLQTTTSGCTGDYVGSVINYTVKNYTSISNLSKSDANQIATVAGQIAAQEYADDQDCILRPQSHLPYLNVTTDGDDYLAGTGSSDSLIEIYDDSSSTPLGIVPVINSKWLFTDIYISKDLKYRVRQLTPNKRWSAFTAYVTPNNKPLSRKPKILTLPTPGSVDIPVRASVSSQVELSVNSTVVSVINTGASNNLAIFNNVNLVGGDIIVVRQLSPSYDWSEYSYAVHVVYKSASSIGGVHKFSSESQEDANSLVPSINTLGKILINLTNLDSNTFYLAAPVNPAHKSIGSIEEPVSIPVNTIFRLIPEFSGSIINTPSLRVVGDILDFESGDFINICKLSESLWYAYPESNPERKRDFRLSGLLTHKFYTTELSDISSTFIIPASGKVELHSDTLKDITEMYMENASKGTEFQILISSSSSAIRFSEDGNLLLGFYKNIVAESLLDSTTYDNSIYAHAEDCLTFLNVGGMWRLTYWSGWEGRLLPLLLESYKNSSRIETLANKPVGLLELYVGNLSPFDSSGLGLPGTYWEDYAIANGNNNTENLSGRSLIGLDINNSDFNSIGKSGGSSDYLLTLDNIPSHSHAGSVGTHTHMYKDTVYSASLPVGYSMGSNVSEDATNILIGSSLVTNDSKAYYITRETEESTHNSSTSASGGGQSFKVLTPYKVVLILQKIK